MLFPLSDLAVRAFNYKWVVEEGLNPREYKVPDGPMVTNAMLAFKIWGKTPCLGCYFQNLADGKNLCCMPTMMPTAAAIRRVMARSTSVNRELEGMSIG